MFIGFYLPGSASEHAMTHSEKNFTASYIMWNPGVKLLPYPHSGWWVLWAAEQFADPKQILYSLRWLCCEVCIGGVSTHPLFKLTMNDSLKLVYNSHILSN